MDDLAFPFEQFRMLSPPAQQDIRDLMSALVRLNENPHDMIAAAAVKSFCRRYAVSSETFLQQGESHA